MNLWKHLGGFYLDYNEIVIEISDTEGRLQVETNQTARVVASHLRFTIVSGWDDFCSVHRLNVDGRLKDDSS